MMGIFLEKYKKAVEEKESVLCVGLDPATKEFRENNTVPENYFEEKEAGVGLLDFCNFILEETCEHTSAVKINSQYVLFHMDIPQLKALNITIHECGMVSILDHKLGDISDSNIPALYWANKTGFDAITYSPFAGNIEDTTKKAHEFDLGIFVLTLMSNPESEWVQKGSKFHEKPLYEEIAGKVNEFNSDGLVVGATGHVEEEDIKKIRSLAGEAKVFLCPGVGFQGGDIEKLIQSAGENILINVSRGIIFDKDPESKAKEFKEEINKFR